MGLSRIVREALFDLLFQSARLHHGRGAVTEADSVFSLWLHTVESEHGRESGLYAHGEARRRAIEGDNEMALQHLQTALDRGFADPWIARNREFRVLYGDPRFEAIVVEVMERAGISEMGR